MACECLVIGSDTAPVRDALTHEVNGILLNFFDVDGLADALIKACREQRAFLPLRISARSTVLDQFDRSRKCTPAWLKLVADVTNES
jgi:glycosyltransferase involved in cell wall biosynthesis